MVFSFGTILGSRQPFFVFWGCVGIQTVRGCLFHAVRCLAAFGRGRDLEYEQFTDFTCPHVFYVHLCFVPLFLVAPVDESALHVEAFWIKKIRMVAELPCVVVLGFLLGGIPLEGHIGSRFLSAFGVLR